MPEKAILETTFFCLFWIEALFSQGMSADAKYPFPVSKKRMFWKANHTIKGSSQKSLGEETFKYNQKGNSTFIFCHLLKCNSFQKMYIEEVLLFLF